MKDIVVRLRSWTIMPAASPASDLMDEAADEIERLRSSYATATHRLAEELARLRLTDSERDVLREVCRVYADEDDAGCNEIAYVIDRLLERLGGTVKSKKCLKRERVANHPEREPVAWVAFATDGSESRYVSATQEQAQAIADDYNWCIAPLFAGLADAEREALEECVRFAFPATHPTAATLRGLLDRTK